MPRVYQPVHHHIKLRSSLTLFLLAAPEDVGFRAALERYYGGQSDPLTMRVLGPQARDT